MMKPDISVIICTHNPRRDYLNRVLAALKSQTLPQTQWELLLIDNASIQSLAAEIDLGWHPHARHIREEQLGLTPARLCGIHAAQAELLVFVDDDNVLAPDYLEVALNIGEAFASIGAWGGQTLPEFEETPPEWTKPYWGMLGIREFDRDKWSNIVNQHETTPCGAGMCVRKVVAQEYARRVKDEPRRFNLDRKGSLLTSCGDADLAFTACDIGLGTGLFVALKLTHLMPKQRLQEEYLLRLREAMSYSDAMLDSFRGNIRELPGIVGQSRLIESYLLLRSHPQIRRFYLASKRGHRKAFQEVTSGSN